MGIKVFAFDCGGVLLRESDTSVYDRWGERLGMTTDALRRSIWAGEAWSLAEIGELTEETFWVRIGDELGLDGDDVRALGDDLWALWTIDPAVLALIDRVRERYRVAMVSNATDVLDTMLAERYGVADRFETIVNSARVGVAKPDPAIYEELLRRVRVEAQEVVFVDDRAENVTAAAAMGMHVLWFISPQELARQLEQYLRPAAVQQPASGRA